MGVISVHFAYEHWLNPRKKVENSVILLVHIFEIPLNLLKPDGTIEIAIVENPYAHIQNTKFRNRKNVRYTEFNLIILYLWLWGVYVKKINGLIINRCCSQIKTFS